MVLHFHYRQRNSTMLSADLTGQFHSSCHGVVPGMHIAGDDLRRHFKEPCVSLCRLLQRFDASKIRQVPNIRGRIEKASGPDAEGVLQLSADSKNTCSMAFPHVLSPCGQHVRERRVTSGSADHIGFVVIEVHDRVIRPDPDLAVMGQNTVAEVPEFLQRLRVIPADRGSRYISACHHKAVRHLDPVCIVEYKELYRRIGKHDAYCRVSGRNGRTEPSLRLLFKQKNRLLVSCEDLPLPFTYYALPLDGRFVAHHHCKRFDRSGLPCTQLRNSLFIGRVAAQMESSDPFDRRDPALGDDPAGPGDRFPASHRLFSRQIDFRAAFIAADGLGVVAPARRRMILLSALRAHRKHLHTGPLPVIRQRVQDRKARSAACTVYKRMQVSSVSGIIELRFAFLADRNIRRDKDLALGLGALDDLERFEAAL